MEWLAGLNALRFFAIILVVVYHLFRDILPGGFIAVEIFFAISGFLIFSKLITEYETRDKIQIWKYLKRRLTRIYPSLFACIAFTILLSYFLHPDLIVGMPLDALAAGTFSTNIIELLQGGAYEETFTPNLFEQTWFLGLEIQLCVIAPFAVLLFSNLARKRKYAVRALGIGLLACAMLSGVLMALYGGAFGQADRAYFAPDTHLMAFFLGGAYAVFNFMMPRTPRTPKAAPAIGLILSLTTITILASKVNYSDAVSFYFVMPFTSFLTIVMLACIIKLQRNRHSRRKKSRLLQMADYIGSLSFGIYLFHWPLYLVLPHMLPESSPECLAPLLCIALSILLTILVKRIFAPSMRRAKDIILPKTSSENFKHQVLIWSSRALVLLAISVPCAFLLYRAPEESSITQQLNTAKIEESQIATAPDYISYRSLFSETERIVTREFELATDSTSNVVERPYLAALNPDSAKVLVIGDSVTLGAKDEIEHTIELSYVDARESRGIESASRLLSEYSTQGRLPDVIVISLATNERTMSDAIFEGILNAGGSDKKYIFVTGYAGPQQPRETQNAAIKHFAETHDNVFVADWWTVSHADWSLMYADHIHLNPQGRAVYADLLKSVIDRSVR